MKKPPPSKIKARTKTELWSLTPEPDIGRIAHLLTNSTNNRSKQTTSSETWLLLADSPTAPDTGRIDRLLTKTAHRS
jgi:hypothetical protein